MNIDGGFFLVLFFFVFFGFFLLSYGVYDGKLNWKRMSQASADITAYD